MYSIVSIIHVQYCINNIHVLVLTGFPIGPFNPGCPLGPGNPLPPGSPLSPWAPG